MHKQNFLHFGPSIRSKCDSILCKLELNHALSLMYLSVLRPKATLAKLTSKIVLCNQDAGDLMCLRRWEAWKREILPFPLSTSNLGVVHTVKSSHHPEIVSK